MKQYFIALTILFFFSGCHSQETEVFRLFDKELNNTILTAKIENKKSLEITSINDQTKEKTQFIVPLESTTKENIYFFKQDKFNGAKTKGLAVLEFIENENALSMYTDTVFVNKEQVENFISKPLNLEKTMGFYLVKKIQIEQANKMPFIKNISAEDVKTLKNRNNERIKKLKLLPEKLDYTMQFKIFMKQQMWLNMQCLLLGYKFPLSNEEHEWLVDILNK